MNPFWKKGWWLFGAQALAHLSIPLMIVFAEPRHYAIAFFTYFITGCLGMSVTYHRLWSHRSWRAPQWFQKFGSLVGCLGLTGSPLAWTAIHRAHHMCTDRPQDPHSPLHQEFWRVQFLSMFQKPNLLLVKDLVKNDWLRFLHTHYFTLNLAVALTLLVVEPFALVYAYLFPAAILWNAGSLINNLGHKWGYRNFNTADQSRNNIFLGLFMWGEGWHNNHHKRPVRASFSVRPFEVDISAYVIWMLRR